MSRVIQPQALLSPIFERVCNAWLRACRHSEPSSLRSRGKTASDGRRVSAQESMSRTKKSGSTAQRSTSVSNRPGSAREPAAKAAFSRVEEFDALKASARRASCWDASRDGGRCDGVDDEGDPADSENCDDAEDPEGGEDCDASRDDSDC